MFAAFSNPSSSSSSFPPTPSRPLASPGQLQGSPGGTTGGMFRPPLLSTPSQIQRVSRPPTLEERLAASEGKQTPVALKEVMNEFVEAHAEIVVSFARISDTLMEYHGWEIRELEPGQAITFLVENFLQLTRGVSYLNMGMVTKSAARLTKGLGESRVAKARQEESASYFKLRVELSEKIRRVIQDTWDYLKGSDEALALMHMGLTDELREVPALAKLRGQNESLHTILSSLARVWMKETPTSWDRNVRSFDVVALKRSQADWEGTGSLIGELEQKMRREVQVLVQRMQKGSWVSRDNMAMLLQTLWEPWDYTAKPQEAQGNA